MRKATKVKVYKGSNGRCFIGFKTCICCEQEFISRHNTQKYCNSCSFSEKWYHRKYNYGINKKQFEEILNKQGGICALCTCDADCVDHCHTHGYVRGILCNNCNRFLGFIESRELWLKRAIEYLRKGNQYAIQKQGSASLSVCKRARSSEEICRTHEFRAIQAVA